MPGQGTASRMGDRMGDKDHEGQVLEAPAIGRGTFSTTLPSQNITLNIPYRFVRCTCGMMHTRTTGYESFECSNCGRLYIWAGSTNKNPEFPRS